MKQVVRYKCDFCQKLAVRPETIERHEKVCLKNPDGKKTAMFSGDTLDIGVCAEYEDGERFWCHFRSSELEMMQKLYEKYQECLKADTKGDFDLYNAKFEIEEEMAAKEENGIAEQKRKEGE